MDDTVRVWDRMVVAYGESRVSGTIKHVILAHVANPYFPTYHDAHELLEGLAIRHGID